MTQQQNSESNPGLMIQKFKETGDKSHLYDYYRRASYQAIYTKAKPKWIRKFRILIQMMALIPGQTVLDVGCASQMLRSYIEDVGGIYKGLDISLRFEPDYVADAETMEGVDEKFDWIVLSDVLEHLPDPNRAMRRAIEIGERFIVVVPNWYRLERFQFLPRHPADRHITRRAPQQWISAFREAGWEIEQVRGFFYVPSIAFYPVFPLRHIDLLFRTKPFIWLGDFIEKRWADGALRYIGQELIVVGRRS